MRLLERLLVVLGIRRRDRAPARQGAPRRRPLFTRIGPRPRAIANAAAFALGLLGVLLVGAHVNTLTRGDVLPAVVAIGIALPIGWTGADFLRRR